MTILELTDELLYLNYRHNRLVLGRIPRGYGRATEALESRYQHEEQERLEELRWEWQQEQTQAESEREDA